MFENILISDKNRYDIENFLKNPSHAILLTGPTGYGKLSLAKYLSHSLLNIDLSNQLEQHPYFYVISPENKLISIDKIRGLKKLLYLKTTGRNTIRRVIIIENADLMNDEAQNSLLKILEEPPSDTVIILTAKSRNKLKNTILSRAQTIRLNKSSLKIVTNYFKKRGYQVDDIKKHYLFTNGSIGLMSSLLVDSNNDFVEYIREAKSLLSESLIFKLNSVDDILKERSSLSDRLYALKQVSKSALYNSIESNDIKLVEYWIRVLKIIQKSEECITKGANTKLLLTNLMLNL